MSKDNLQSRNNLPLPALAPKLYMLHFFRINITDWGFESGKARPVLYLTSTEDTGY